ncbi:MAG TPA: alpha/beta hydrolase [Firmicutes bacterium]|nr:alpha/beta hydrolase [Bacillota bacterium]
MIFCTAVIVFAVGSFIAIKIIYDSNFPRADKPQFSNYLRFEDVPEYEKQVVQFKSGPNTLTGYLFGKGNNKGLVVVAHGLGGGTENYLQEIIYFVDQGWTVFAYDCTGSHASEGKSTVGLAQSLLDLNAALNYIKSREELNRLPVMLFGHSWGGYAVAAVLNYDHPITAAVSVSGFNSPMDMLFEQAKRMMGGFTYVQYPFMWLYQTMLFGKSAWVSAVDGINKSGVPVMIIHGDKDNTIYYTGAAIIAHKNEITNPNVFYKTCSKEGHNGHSNLFYSEAAIMYRAIKNQEYKELNERLGGEIPEDVKAAYYQEVDRFLWHQLDKAFMDDINHFFESALH